MTSTSRKTKWVEPSCQNSPQALVSVIIPMFNSEETISSTLSCVQRQSYERLEIIVVDDGSTDSSADKVEAISRKDSRVRLVRCKNAGAGTARNRGLDIAVGEWVMFVDSDDALPEGAVACLLASHSGCPVVKGAVRFSSDEEDIPETGAEYVLDAHDACRLALTFWDNRDLVPSPLFSKGVVFRTACACLIRRSLLESNEIRFPVAVKYGEDALFMTHVYHAAGKIAALDRWTYQYNANPHSVTKTVGPNDVRAVADTLDALKQCSSMYSCCQELLKASGVREILTLANRLGDRPIREVASLFSHLACRDAFEWAMSAGPHRYSRGVVNELGNQITLALLKRGHIVQAMANVHCSALLVRWLRFVASR